MQNVLIQTRAPQRFFAALPMLFCLLAAIEVPCFAQTLQPAPAPAASPAATPVSAPAPTPGGDTPPPVTMTPGVVDTATMAAYSAARTPQASVVLAPAASLAARGATAAASAADVPSTQPTIQGGVSTLITVPSASPAPGFSNKAAGAGGPSPAAAAGSALQPLPAAVTLTYGADRAGQPVWVQTLHGGALSAPDDTGEIHNADGGGFYLIISAAGTVTFTFQAPAASDVYQVYTRLDNVATTLLFDVPDPNS